MLSVFARTLLRQRSYVALLDYPVRRRTRWGYGRPANPYLEAMMSGKIGDYIDRFSKFLEFAQDLRSLDAAPDDGITPTWRNTFFSGMDAIAMYGFLRSLAPQTFMEIGSGHSTRFARRAVRDGKLSTKIVSIDPYPRAEIDRLCDEIVRAPVEEIDHTVFARLRPGDILSFDGSHVCFENTDVTVFFLEILPAVPPGVTIHVHDIYLPYDYPPDAPYWNEQYVLGAYLLGAKNVDVVMPNAYVSQQPEFARTIAPFWEANHLDDIPKYGASFWMVHRGT